MNMVQMRSFHAVATTGSFVGASRLLNISQPTITTQVKSLEEAYGVELFSRQGRGVQLTEYGRTLFALTQKTMANFQETVEFLKESKGLRIGHLRLAAVGSRQVVAVLGFEPKRIAGFESEVLVLGGISDEHGIVLLRPDREIEDGSPVA